MDDFAPQDFDDMAFFSSVVSPAVLVPNQCLLLRRHLSGDFLFRRRCFFRRTFLPGKMNFTSPAISSSSLLFPMSSVTFSAIRPPPAPPPEPPSPPAPPGPPDPPDSPPQIRSLSDVSLSHSSYSLCFGPIVAVLFSRFGQPLIIITSSCVYGEPAKPTLTTFFTMPQPLRPSTKGERDC